MVGDEDELENKNESDDGGTRGGKPKTCVDVLLVHKVSKQEENEEEVHLGTCGIECVCVCVCVHVCGHKTKEGINCEQVSQPVKD